MTRGVLVVLATVSLLLGVAFASDAKPCTIAGTWYGGSVVAYQLTIIPTAEDDHYTIVFQPMFTDGAKDTSYTGTLVKKGSVYEGSSMQMTSADPAFATSPPTLGLMPDLNVVWASMKLVDCNTISNFIPFFGTYTAKGGVWNGQKTPLVDAPDVDLLDFLTGGQPVVETYHRLPSKVNPALLHQ
jgi:hypothetical protein